MQTTTSPLSAETVGIVGGGAMGRGIAQIAALAGLTVKLFDTNPQALDAARAYLAKTFAQLADKGKLSAGTVRRRSHVYFRAVKAVFPLLHQTHIVT